ncbi:MAG: hypothetical protein GF383_02705 [Candidatus Lokiarchaeota archaeon]|nr:hypothetical protein [Candidatus Lokiarchaeota archaeon]
MAIKIKGMIPPIITPLKMDESIDSEGFKSVIDFLVKGGVSGIFILGTASEFAYFTFSERIQIAEIVRDHLSSKIPLLMGISDPSLNVSLRLIKKGLNIDVDGFVANIPQYFTLGSKEIKESFTKFKEKCQDKPLFAYEVSEIVPTTARLEPKMIVELANQRIINGMKYSGVLWEDYAKIILEGIENKEEVSFFAGTEIITRLIYENGIEFDGGIYSGLNVFPRLYSDTFHAIKNKKKEKISNNMKLLFSTGGIFGAMGSAGTPTIMKYMLNKLGLPITTKVRSPLPNLNKRINKKIEKLFGLLSKNNYLDRYE